MGREKISRPRRTHNDNDFGPLIASDIGKDDLFDRSIAGTNLAGAEKCGFIPTKGDVIKPNAETADGTSLEVPFCNHGCLTRRKFDLRDEAL